MNYAVWNTLHDGGVESAAGEVPGNVTLLIGIEYLCEKLPTAAKVLELRLLRCVRFEYETFEGDRVTNLGELGARDVEILSADREGDSVAVECVDGILKLCYEDVEIRLLEGSIISQADLEAAAQRYWTEWSLRHANK